MNVKTRIAVILAAVTASKQAIGGALATGVVAATISPALGFDPWTWIVGAIGGVVIRVKLPETSRPDSIINGIISVMLAGLGSQYILQLITFESLPKPNIYLVAFVIAAAWPWILAAGWKFAKDKLDLSSKEKVHE